jgi:hypothetical protein
MQSKEILLNLGMITVPVHVVGAVKIYVAVVEALRRTFKRGQNTMKLSLPPKYKMAHYRTLHSFEIFFFPFSFCKVLQNLKK